MSRRSSHHTLREMRAFFAKPLTLVLLGAAVILLGVSGPFGTHDSLSFGPRLAYWAVTAPTTFALGVMISIYASHRLENRVAPWLATALTALATSCAVCLAVTAINWLAFERAPFTQNDFIELMISVTAVTVVITIVLLVLPQTGIAAPAQSHQPPPLLDRLAFANRGALISLSVQDHYVEVTTTKGSELILMRLSDAIREVGATEGLQVHRSHWVAKGQIAAAARQGDKALLTMKDGREIPASRSNIAALKESGILPG